MGVASDSIRSRIYELEQLANKADNMADFLVGNTAALSKVIADPVLGGVFVQELRNIGAPEVSPEMFGELMKMVSKPAPPPKAPWVSPDLALNNLQMHYKTYGDTKKENQQITASFHYEAFGNDLKILCRAFGDRTDVWNKVSFGAMCEDKPFKAGNKGTRGVSLLGCNVLTAGNILVIPRGKAFSVSEYVAGDERLNSGTIGFMTIPQYLHSLLRAIRALGYRDLDKLLYEAYYSADMQSNTPMKMFIISPRNTSRYAYFSYDKCHAYYNGDLQIKPTRQDINNFVLLLVETLGGEEAVNRFKSEVTLHIGWHSHWQGEYDQDNAIIC